MGVNTVSLFPFANQRVLPSSLQLLCPCNCDVCNLVLFFCALVPGSFKHLVVCYIHFVAAEFLEEVEEFVLRFLKGITPAPTSFFFTVSFFLSTMMTRARAKALAAEARGNCIVVSEDLEDPSIPGLVL
ncbi:5-dehydro-4-deoxy-D-glucuronate isomerase [Sesbania bispinosa]|nr:5-dehydro-4-deoxy-D-glucuronate isomerase [Sesbania bispinosa]